MPIVHSGKIQAYYEEEGSGEPLVLLAGFSCDVNWWYPVASFLKPFFRLILLEYRGGGKGVYTETFTIQDLAQDVVHAMEFLNIDRASIMGHSMGGAIAQQVAISHPERVKHLCLLSSFSHLREPALFFLEATLKMREAAVPVDLIIEVALPWGFSSEFLRDLKKIAEYKKFLLSTVKPPSLQGLKARCQVLRAFDTRESLHKIRAKTIVITTQRDFFIPLTDTEKLVEKIPGAKLLVLAEEGHNLLLEAPERVAREIRHFMGL